MIIKQKRSIFRKPELPVSLRSPRDEKRYQAIKRFQPKRDLTKERPIQEWTHWYLLPNMFPYSAAFDTHHMLLPKRVVSRKHLNISEKAELDDIIDELESLYDVIMMNFQSKQSVRDHFHVHLLTYKTNRKDLKL